MARRFNGSGDFIDLGAPLTSFVGTSAYSVAFWFYPDGASTLSMLGDENSTDTDSGIEAFMLASTAFWLRSYIGGSPVTISGGAANITAWNHYAATYDGSNLTLFGNGSQASQLGCSGNISTPPFNLFIGRRGSVSGFYFYWAGNLAEYSFWDTALTAAEIAALSQGYSGLFIRPGNIVGHWPLIGRTSPEIDIVGGVGGALTGTSAIEHPRIIMPSGPGIGHNSAAGASTFPWAWAQGSNLPVLGTGNF